MSDGDPLPANGRISADTVRSIALAYARVTAIEPFVTGARQISDVASLSAEHLNPGSFRNHSSDDGAA